MKPHKFHRDVLLIEDPALLVDKICERIRQDIFHVLNRVGAVVGISGGIDSSLTLALCCRALGADKVLGVMMPEKDSSPESLQLAESMALQWKVDSLVEDITMPLRGYRCYERRDEAVKELIPDYHSSRDQMKIGIKPTSKSSSLPPVFYLTVIKPDGSELERRLPSDHLRRIVAATNFKQRTRMSFLYFHAERLHHAVVGTPNKHEVEQGFFVKHGDGAGDLFPLGQLYKSQVYQLARHLQLPEEIIQREPTTDTYSAEQSQEEFFYRMPFQEMDLLWYAFEHEVDPKEASLVLSMKEAEVRAKFENFARTRASTAYLRRFPINDYHFL